MYLLGEPIFKPKPRERFEVPAGQAGLCLEVLNETDSRERIQEELRKEYLAIACALQRMGIDFGIAIAHPDDIDSQVAMACKQTLGCKLYGFTPDYFPPSVCYPRDFCSVFPELILLNPHVQVVNQEKDGWKVISSPFGEGGLIHVSEDKVVACERIIPKDGESREANDSDLAPILKTGMNLCLMPAVVGGAIIDRQISDRIFSSNHIDRVSTLLAGEDGKTHLVMDPGTFGVDWQGANESPPWNPIFPPEMISLMKGRCEPSGISVHSPERLRVPYILNLIQFKSGEVLMSSGDPDVEDLIQSIVGADKVFTTEIPIRYYPTWCYAGIRCLIGNIPNVIFKKVN